MTKIIHYGDEGRRNIYEGIKKVADAVKVTMGPKGRNVILEKSYGAPVVTNDGVTVAKEINLEDKFENIGAELVKEAATKTNDAAGDGTTTTVVLVDAIANEGLRYIRSGVNPFALGRGLHKAVEKIITDLQAKSKPIATKEEIMQVATISAQDEEVGQLIADIMDEVWKDWIITVEEGKSMGLTKEVVKGMQFDQGYASAYFVTDSARMEAIQENPAVLITDKKISSLKDIVHLLEQLATKGKREFVIIADDIEGEALASLVLNKLRGALNILAVKAPGFGDRKKEMLKDIATVTGATIITEELGITFENATVEMFGSADKIISDKDKTTIVGGKWLQSSIDERAEQIKFQINKSTSDYDKEKLYERLAKLISGVAVIKVWAATEMEMKNRKYKIEDALNATKAAVEEGIVPGWGTVLVKLSKELNSFTLSDSDEQIWVEIIKEAIQYPVRQIANNAGYRGDAIIEKVKEHSDFAHGFDAKQGQFIDLIKQGVIDPVKVIRVALQNAASSAAMVLTTDAVITDAPKKDSAPSDASMGWMGGMGGMWWMGWMWF